MKYEWFHEWFAQVACMQFINIVVHSVENMNFRVHLQYEFTQLGLDQYLEVSLVLHTSYTYLIAQYFRCFLWSVYS